MNRDSEALQRSLLKLLQEILPDASPADVEALRQNLELPQDGEELLSPATLHFQDAPSVDSSLPDSDSPVSQIKSSLELGEPLTVQDRFHALLKRRLESEIQRNPPLFPWETEVLDYGTEPIGFAAERAIAQPIPVALWFSQLRALRLPVAVPDAVLTQLFQRCQEMVNSSLLEGAKLVRAVEELFPDQSQALNHLAGMVMTSPARSTDTAPTSDASYPDSYEAAVPAQQMVLSLLAAREILGALTLTISPSQPISNRQWLTEIGELALRTEYDAAVGRLKVQGNLPCAGSLLLRGNGLQTIAQRLDPGTVSVELFNIQPHQPYALEVQFADQPQAPLGFAIRIDNEAV